MHKFRVPFYHLEIIHFHVLQSILYYYSKKSSEDHSGGFSLKCVSKLEQDIYSFTAHREISKNKLERLTNRACVCDTGLAPSEMGGGCRTSANRQQSLLAWLLLPYHRLSIQGKKLSLLSPTLCHLPCWVLKMDTNS